MDSIRISNLRCLADSTTITIKPISLLVGANSSGKSTFLRLFPLIRQSHEMRALGGLVLNEGDVDFGFFQDALRKDADPPEMKLEFGFTLDRGLYQGPSWNIPETEVLKVSCELSYVQRLQDPRYPRLRQVRLALTWQSAVDNIVLISDEDGGILEFRVNDFSVNTEERKSFRLRVGKGVVPQLSRALVKEDNFDGVIDVVSRGSGPFDRRLLSETSSYFHGRTAEETRLALFQSVQVGSPERMLATLRNNGVGTWKDRTSGWNVDSKGFRALRNLLLAKRMNDVLDSASVYLNQLAKSVFYFQPVRAKSERDYVSRDVSVTSVNSTGLNVAMVLASLSRQELSRFRDWMRKNFGFEVFPHNVADGTRVALRMREAGNETEFNLADTGFGFSQMLPFLVQVWSLTSARESARRRSNVQFYSRFESSTVPTSYIIAIEQPELHLHPALQAKLADLFVAMIKLSKAERVPIRFVLETHSQALIERIGQSVDCKLIDPDDVQVILFERDTADTSGNTSSVRTTSFDTEGVLIDWPFGFLSAPLTPPQKEAAPAPDALRY